MRCQSTEAMVRGRPCVYVSGLRLKVWSLGLTAYGFIQRDIRVPVRLLTRNP